MIHPARPSVLLVANFAFFLKKFVLFCKIENWKFWKLETDGRTIYVKIVGRPSESKNQLRDKGG